jgi:hypothetical protein
MKLITKGAVLRIIIFFFLAYTIIMGSLSFLSRMPGQSYEGPLLPLSEKETALRSELRRQVEMLCVTIGERNYIFYKNLNSAADYIEQALIKTGISVQRHQYRLGDKTYYNIVAEKKGALHPEEIIIVGAHYDSVLGSPGANDNASGVAAVIALAQALSETVLARTIRFICFVNEEPPFFWTKDMGSYVYAQQCKERNENIIAMLSLETIGYYSKEPGSQHYFFPPGFFYPSRGNFIGFVSNLSSRPVLKNVIEIYRRTTKFPSQGGVFPWFTPGVFWSDHWPFWKMGYPAILVTDTALFRYPYYHSAEDTVDKINYDHMARMVAGLEKVIEELANAQ